MQKVKWFILVALCLGFVSNLPAQEDLKRPVSVVPTIEPAKGESASSVEAIILSSIVQELTQEGFDVRSEETGPRSKGDYYIKAIYEADGTAIDLDISASKSRRGTAIATASWQGALNMTTDVAIQELMRNEILPELPRTIGVTQREVDEAAGEGEEWALALIAESATKEYIPPRYRPWRFDAGGHAVILLGPDSEYYDTGTGARVSAGYAFKVGQFELQPALVSGYQAYRYEGIIPNQENLGPNQLTEQERQKAIQGDDFIIPFAAEFKATYLDIKFVQPYLRVALGAAWYQRKTEKIPISPESEYSGFQEFLILLQAGIGAEYQILPYLGAYADVSAQFLFGGNSDSLLPNPTIHFTPGLGITARF